jgi:hypothetical protein
MAFFTEQFAIETQRRATNDNSSGNASVPHKAKLSYPQAREKSWLAVSGKLHWQRMNKKDVQFRPSLLGSPGKLVSGSPHMGMG